MYRSNIAVQDQTIQSHFPKFGSKTRHIYEVNYHTTGGAGGDYAAIKDFILGEGSLGLCLHVLLSNMKALQERGGGEQCIFTLDQYSQGGDIPIWGVTYGVSSKLLRPMGIAMEMVNTYAKGKLMAVSYSIEDILLELPNNNMTSARQVPKVIIYPFYEEETKRLRTFYINTTNEVQPVPIVGLIERMYNVKVPNQVAPLSAQVIVTNLNEQPAPLEPLHYFLHQSGEVEKLDGPAPYFEQLKSIIYVERGGE